MAKIFYLRYYGVSGEETKAWKAEVRAVHPAMELSLLDMSAGKARSAPQGKAEAAGYRMTQATRLHWCPHCTIPTACLSELYLAHHVWRVHPERVIKRTDARAPAPASPLARHRGSEESG